MYKLEQTFDEWFVKKAPFQLPPNAKETLVKIMPWLTLIGGVLSALAVLSLYNLAMWAQGAVNYSVNAGLYAYGAGSPPSMVGVWLGLAILALEAVLFFIAFPALRARKKSGWNLLYYVAAANVVYALIYLFVNQDIGSFVLSAVSSVIGLYILFQVRSFYLGTTQPAAKRTTTPPQGTNTAK